MGISGIASSTWDETEEKTGYVLVPPGHALDFEIGAIKEGTSPKNQKIQNEYFVQMFPVGFFVFSKVEWNSKTQKSFSTLFCK